MSQESVERILGRMITDKNFRTLVSASLEAVSRQEGFLLTPVELKLLTTLEMKYVAELAGRLNPCLRRAGTVPDIQ